MEFTDREIPCRRCGETFMWSGGEQEFYTSKGLLPPRYCKPCRKIRRESIAKAPPPQEDSIQ